MADDDEEGGFGGLYEDGHWAWDESAKELVFVSDLPPQLVEAIQIPTKAPTGTVEFRDDVDLIEQIRFRRRYQRKLKSGQAEIISVQDVKDIAIYTAPVNILSPMLINMLHLPTTERFIRALILYSQYYLQIADEMAHRIIELETKVRTPQCEILENEYRDNLSDLRLLIAKEYSTMLIGTLRSVFSIKQSVEKIMNLSVLESIQLPRVEETPKSFTTWGPRKNDDHCLTKMQDFLKLYYEYAYKLFGWLWGEGHLTKLIFNAVEHTLRTGYVAKMAAEERAVLLGYCVRHDKKLNTRSPLMNDVFCHRDIDYRMMGLGVIKCSQITPRLLYMMHAVAGPEESLHSLGIVLGIIGMSRSSFDTMLRPLPTGTETGKSKASVSSASYSSRTSTTSSMRKSQLAAQKLYPDIVLPRKESRIMYFPPSFPDEPEDIKPCSETQRRRWQNRLMRLLHPQGHSR